MTQRRLEALQWYALLGGALAWTTQHVLAYFVSAAGCSTSVAGWDVNIGLWQIVLMVLGLAGVLAAGAAGLVVYRATAGVAEDAPGPEGRMHFFALAALVGNTLFLMLVLLDGAGVLYHLDCRLT